jgi:SAM-dependent methyltransferase
MRFEEAAHRLLAFSGVDAGSRVLDLGTGTGAMPSTLGRASDPPAVIVGCDRSVPMLEGARRRVAGGHFVTADVRQLPFRAASFDLVTANCVLSHLHRCQEALLEARRVLRRGGAVAASSWGPASDAHAAAWSSLLADAVGAEAVNSAVAEVVPTEVFLGDPANLSGALADAGLVDVRVVVTDLEFAGLVEDYLADRRTGAGARFARHVLGEARWRHFLEDAERELLSRFGPRITYRRPLLLACGTVP